MQPFAAHVIRPVAMNKPVGEQMRDDLRGDLRRGELAERARYGDREAFAALFEAYNGRICTYLARLVGDDEMCRDLAQDAFLAAWRALPRVTGELRFGPWLYRIATNAARSHLRRAALIRWLPWTEETTSAVGQVGIAGPDAHAGEAEAVKLALAQLAPQCRICLLLQIEGGFSQREIAELLGISEKSVSAYVSRGREQFRRAHQWIETDADAQSNTNGTGGPAQ